MTTASEDVTKIHCNGCAAPQPLYNFVERHLMEWREKDTVAQEAMCARCYIRSQTLVGPRTTLKCKECGKDKHIREFTSVAIRHWLLQDRHNDLASCCD